MIGLETTKHPGVGNRRSALTLLELLVVLVILAVVATVAVNSLQPRVEAARFEQTQKQLQQVRDSILGPEQARQSDGTPLISGFVADVGRYPLLQANVVAASDSDTPVQGQELSELWSVQTELAQSYPFQFRAGPKTPVNYSDVQLPCGWRGPYLQLSMGSQALRDPWNRPFELLANSEMEVQSLVWQPIGAYDQPLATDLTNGKVSVTGAINFGQTAPSNIEVVMLVPDPNSSRSELAVLADEDDSPTTFTFSHVPIGVRAICVTAEGRRLLTRFVHVHHQGLSLVFDLNQESSNVPQQSNE